MIINQNDFELKGKTLADALAMGYTYGHSVLHRGYISRKLDPMKQEVKYSKTNFDYQNVYHPYVLFSNPDSTWYCKKTYLVKGEMK